MTLSIIIVNWNSRVLVRQCLASLVACCRLEDLELIVVDSGSFDGCGDMLAAEFPAVRFLQCPDNVGFARANNLASRHARGRQLLFLNPDTLLSEDSPARLSRRLQELPRVGALGCRLLNTDQTVQTSCIQSFPTVLNQMLDAQWLRQRFPRSRLWGMAALFDGSQLPSRVAAISGACLAVNRDAFEAVGGFTESYFMYGEDMDLCRKLHDAGWGVYYTPETSLVHIGGGSSRQAPGRFSVVMMRTSVHRFILIHQGRLAAGAYRVGMGLAAIARLALLGVAQLGRRDSGSWQKWRTTLRWSAGLEPIAATRPAAAPALVTS
jgi:GT2 family glycosyltransferase